MFSSEVKPMYCFRVILGDGLAAWAAARGHAGSDPVFGFQVLFHTREHPSVSSFSRGRIYATNRSRSARPRNPRGGRIDCGQVHGTPKRLQIGLADLEGVSFFFQKWIKFFESSGKRNRRNIGLTSEASRYEKKPPSGSFPG